MNLKTAASVVAWLAVPVVFFWLMGIVFLAAGLASIGGTGGGSSSGSGAGETVKGDVEFMFTYYDPAVGGINGSVGGGAHGRVFPKSGTPTGYEVTEDSTGKKYTGGGAIPQETAVDYNKVPLPYLHGPASKWKNKGIIIPCYNNDQPFPATDHYATSITAPNALDLVMTGEAHSKFQQCLQQRKIKTSPANNGYSPATKIKGKIVELKS